MATTPDPLEDQIVSALRRIVRAIDLQSRRLAEACGLTGPQILILREASRLSGSSISALARAASLGQPTVSGILDRLEAQGLVRRDRSTEDRRAVYVRLTPEGARLLERAPSLLQDRFHTELSRLQEWERTQILALLQRLASMMDADAIDAAPMLETGPLERPDPATGLTREAGRTPEAAQTAASGRGMRASTPGSGGSGSSRSS